MTDAGLHDHPKPELRTLHDLAGLPRWVAWQTERRDGGKPTKVPYAPGGRRRAETDDPSTWGLRYEAEATRLPMPFGQGGIGLELGDLGDGRAVGGIDLDTCRDVDGTLAPWAVAILTEFDTYSEISPSGSGVKLFFTYDLAALPELTEGWTGKKSGKKWALPGNDHPPGIELYLTSRYFAVTDLQHPDAPAELRHVSVMLLQRLIRQIGPAFVEAGKVKGSSAGTKGADQSRSALALKMAGQMRRAGATYEQWLQRARTDPQLTDWCREKGEANEQRQLKRTWDKASGAPPAELELTEDGVAIRFAEKYGTKLRFCHDARRWYHWCKNTYWNENRDHLAFSWARELVRSLNRNAELKTKAITGKVAFAAGVERFAQTDRTFAVTGETWDTDPLLLGTPGGTVDLQTGVLRPSKQDEFITKITAVAPAAAGTTCDTWLRFLDDATGKDDGLIRFLQQWCGYCLTGSTEEHALLFVYGPGGNGKSVFLNTVAGILADYATTATMDVFTASKQEKHTTDLAMLRGARLVTASETEQDRAWAEARIKQVTGGDPITARFMHRDNFTFRPAFKLTIAGNHKPTLKNVDAAARRRFNIVPFTRQPSKPDPKLEEKLKAEWPAILRWMIEGCLDWQKNRLVRPKVVTAATAEYFEQQDVFGSWAADYCSMDATQTLMTRPGKLLESYTQWAQQNGERSATRNDLRNWIERQPVLRYKRVNGADHVAGIAVKPPPKSDRGADGGGRD